MEGVRENWGPGSIEEEMPRLDVARDAVSAGPRRSTATTHWTPILGRKLGTSSPRNVHFLPEGQSSKGK